MTNQNIPSAPWIRLAGRIFLEMDIRAVTGLRIGGSPAALAIGGMDNPVIRDPLTQRPYIPGSSLRGKMRSLWEKQTGAPQDKKLQGDKVRIHMLESKNPADYANDRVCRIFGVAGESNPPTPTRLIVHDCFLSAGSITQLEQARTDQPYTETKWEAVIDRITSAAMPRQMERVPAGAVFADARLVYSVFSYSVPGAPAHNSSDDVGWFFDVIQILQLVEDDYLGSAGSRGSGRVRFENIRLSLRLSSKYSVVIGPQEFGSIQQILEARDSLIDGLTKEFAQSQRE